GAATAVAQRAAAESEEVGSRHDSLYGKRILIVEDEPLVAMDMAASLVAAGCEVAGPAGNLRDAKRLVADADFDAALLDANLAGSPVDELAAALARLEIPFAFATGYGQESLLSGFR